MDEWIYLLKNSAIKSNFKAKGIKKAGRVLDKLKMSKEERLAYDDYIYHKRAARGDYRTALGEATEEERKKFEEERNKYEEERKKREEEIKQIENKHNKELQEKDSLLQSKDSQLQEKENMLKQMEKLLLSQGHTKEEIYSRFKNM